MEIERREKKEQRQHRNMKSKPKKRENAFIDYYEFFFIVLHVFVAIVFNRRIASVDENRFAQIHICFSWNG